MAINSVVFPKQQQSPINYHHEIFYTTWKKKKVTTDFALVCDEDLSLEKCSYDEQRIRFYYT